MHESPSMPTGVQDPAVAASTIAPARGQVPLARALVWPGAGPVPGDAPASPRPPPGADRRCAFAESSDFRDGRRGRDGVAVPCPRGCGADEDRCFRSYGNRPTAPGGEEESFSDPGLRRTWPGRISRLSGRPDRTRPRSGWGGGRRRRGGGSRRFRSQGPVTWRNRSVP
jgi:hypothetical protein